jgi:hypothetical protein
MQVDKALDELKWIRKALVDAQQWRDWDEVGRQCGRISNTMALLRPACVCGEPSSPGVVHRQDGPCYFQDAPAVQPVSEL